jgi:uncharacterized protein (DUF1501 family)
MAAARNGSGQRPGSLISSVANPPLSFDFSHAEHRSVQALMWSRVLGVADRLIGLLKSEEWSDGQSLWDRTMIYVANDFGRSKQRPQGAEQFGTGHDLNDGALIISPLANGGRLLGGIDPDTGITSKQRPDDCCRSPFL